MNLPPFKLEEFWRKHEFAVPHLLCCSDGETWKLQEILDLADPEALALWQSLSMGYTEPPGHPLLRREIASLYDTLNPDEIFTFAGAEEGIYCAMKALINPGDHVIIIDPCYQSLATIPLSLGADATTIQLKFENQWKLDLNTVQKAFRPTTKLVILNFPHNPTGTILDADVQDGLIALARESGAHIFCDEVYRFMEVDETARLPSMADAYEKGISLNVMTKTFGLAGLRIGWLASKDESSLHHAGSQKLYTSICNSGVSEIVAIIALRAKEHLLRRNREIMAANLRVLDVFMERHRDKLSWVRPQGGTMAAIKLLLPIPVETFADDLIREQGVLIMPGSVYDLQGNFFRVGFGKRDMPSILERLELHLDKC